MSRISFFVIFALIFFSSIVSCDDFWGTKTPKITYKEGNGKYFEIYKSFNFENDVLVQVIYPRDRKTYCIEPNIDFRLIYGVNGTITPFQIDFPFPIYNFCPGPNGLYGFDIYRLDRDKILIQY